MNIATMLNHTQKAAGSTYAVELLLVIVFSEAELKRVAWVIFLYRLLYLRQRFSPLIVIHQTHKEIVHISIAEKDHQRGRLAKSVIEYKILYNGCYGAVAQFSAHYRALQAYSSHRRFVNDAIPAVAA